MNSLSAVEDVIIHWYNAYGDLSGNEFEPKIPLQTSRFLDMPESYHLTADKIFNNPWVLFENNLFNESAQINFLHLH